MKTLREMLAKQAELKAKGKAMLDAADGRDFTAQEEADFQALEKQLESLGAEIEKQQKAMERRQKMTGDALSGAGGQPLPGLPGGPRVEVGVDRASLDPTGGFRHVAAMAKAVQEAVQPGAKIDERLQYLGAAGPLREGGTDGWLVPQEHRDRIWEVVHEQDDYASEVDGEETSSNFVNDLVDETTPWGGAGIVAAWRREVQQMTAEKPAPPKPRGLALDQLFVFCKASDELLEDAPRLNARLTRKSGEAIRFKLNSAIFGGNGLGQPQGFHLHPCQVSVAKEAAQAADTVNALNVSKMFTRLLPDAVPRSQWLIHSSVFPQVMTMTIGNQPIWTPVNAGFKEAPGGMLLGRPVRFSQHCKQLGDKGDVHLVDFKGYYALKKAGGVKFDTSIHLYFDTAEMAFRWMFRFGGMPHLSAPVSPLNGTDTQSFFITLDERN